MASYRHTYDRPIPKLNSKLRPSEGRPSKTRPSHHSAPTDCVSPFKNLTISIAVNTTFSPFLHSSHLLLPPYKLPLSLGPLVHRKTILQTNSPESLSCAPTRSSVSAPRHFRFLSFPRPVSRRQACSGHHISQQPQSHFAIIVSVDTINDWLILHCDCHQLNATASPSLASLPRAGFDTSPVLARQQAITDAPG